MTKADALKELESISICPQLPGRRKTMYIRFKDFLLKSFKATGDKDKVATITKTAKAAWCIVKDRPPESPTNPSLECTEELLWIAAKKLAEDQEQAEQKAFDLSVKNWVAKLNASATSYLHWVKGSSLNELNQLKLAIELVEAKCLPHGWPPGFKKDFDTSLSEAKQNLKALTEQQFELDLIRDLLQGDESFVRSHVTYHMEALKSVAVVSGMKAKQKALREQAEARKRVQDEADIKSANKLPKEIGSALKTQMEYKGAYTLEYSRRGVPPAAFAKAFGAEEGAHTATVCPYSLGIRDKQLFYGGALKATNITIENDPSGLLMATGSYFMLPH
jgi:hypothetical protein